MCCRSFVSFRRKRHIPPRSACSRPSGAHPRPKRALPAFKAGRSIRVRSANQRICRNRSAQMGCRHRMICQVVSECRCPPRPPPSETVLEVFCFMHFNMIAVVAFRDVRKTAGEVDRSHQ
jgi:hypothetical protein